MLGLEKAMPLPHASSLCGACADVCPVRIPIPDLLVHWREKAAEAGLAPTGEGLGSRLYADLAEHPAAFHAAGAALRHTPWRSVGRALPVLRSWMQERDAPQPSPKSFRQLWREGIE
jgi:L-lactate dehydrogenase complex protein LldF